MWKETLPANCPPKSAFEFTGEIYRIFNGNSLMDDEFVPYSKLSLRYKNVCKAYAISFYNSFDNALEAYRDALSREKKLGNYIAQIQLLNECGKVEFQENSGHYSVWFYQNWQHSNFRVINIVPIDGN